MVFGSFVGKKEIIYRDIYHIISLYKIYSYRITIKAFLFKCVAVATGDACACVQSSVSVNSH